MKLLVIGSGQRKQRCRSIDSNFRDGQGLVHTNGNTVLAAGAFSRFAHDDMVVFLAINSVSANIDTLAAYFALRLV